ncbi:MAG: ATP-dependent DNA helicase, partial [Actinomyces sp.]
MSEHAPRPAAGTRPGLRQPGALPGPAALLDALDPDQRQVAEHLEGALCVLAGAGTGKTRAITYRIAYGVAVGAYQPTQVLAVTFTARAAGEMRSRLADLGVNGTQARTFHSAALRQLTYFWPTAIGGRRPAIEKFKGRLVGTAAHRLGLSADRALIRDLSAEVEWAKVTMTLPEDYAQQAAALRREPPGGLEPATVAQVLAAYEEAKTERGVIDFEDVLLLMVGVLLDREDIADQVRGQYKHFVVDEYQDVSPLQQRLLDLWLGRRRQLCVVGDVSQTIYSFTGATPDFLTGFTTRYAGARTVRLSRDYRSTPQVVSLANRVLSRS